MLSDYNEINLETDKRKISLKPLNIWRLDNKFLNNPRNKEEIKRELESILSSPQKFTALNTCIKIEKGSQIKDLKKVEKEQIKPKVGERK